MNQLNSLIIEGQIENVVPKSESYYDFEKTEILISVERERKIDGKVVEEWDVFRCVCCGKFSKFVRRLFMGDKVRIIGNLRQDLESTYAFIEVEHISIEDYEKEIQLLKEINKEVA